MTFVISHKSRLSDLVDFPQFDDFIFSCCCNPRMPILSAKDNLFVSLKETVKSMSILVDNLRICTIGDHEKIVRRLSFGKFNVYDFIIEANYDVFNCQTVVVNNCYVLLSRNNEKFSLFLPTHNLHNSWIASSSYSSDLLCSNFPGVKLTFLASKEYIVSNTVKCLDVLFCLEGKLELETFKQINSQLLIINCDDLLATRCEAKGGTSFNLSYRFVGNIVENSDLSTEITRDYL